MTIVALNKSGTQSTNINVGNIIHKDEVNKLIIMLVDTKFLSEQDQSFFEQEGLIVEDIPTKNHVILTSASVNSLSDTQWLIEFYL